jgi:hypothetical protein
VQLTALATAQTQELGPSALLLRRRVDRDHRYWSLVESRRCAVGSVQGLVLYLGVVAIMAP